MKILLYFIIVLLVIGGGIYFIFKNEVGDTDFKTNIEVESVNNKSNQNLKTQLVDSNINIKSTESQNNLIKNYRTITRPDFTFEAPLDWLETDSTINDCENVSVINTKQNDSDSIPGQIDIWIKDCMPSFIEPVEKVDKGKYVITASYGEEYGTTKEQIVETKAVYQHVIETFKIKQ